MRMKKRKSPVAVKVIACLLLLGSLAAILLPWMKLAIDTSAGRKYPGELLREYAGMDVGAVRSTVLEELAAEGVRPDSAAFDSLLNRVLDGRFRLTDLAVLCGDLGKLSGSFRQPDAAAAIHTAGTVIWAVTGLLVLLGLVALACQLSDHRGGILPYFLLGTALTAALLVLRGMGNDALARESDALFAELGISSLISFLGVDVRIIKMGIGAYLCPFLALMALLLMGIRQKTPRQPTRPAQQSGTERPAASPYPARRTEEPRGSRPVSDGWICPNCGRACPPERSTCDLCGMERPKPSAAFICPACGKRLTRRTAFCPDCGAKL